MELLLQQLGFSGDGAALSQLVAVRMEQRERTQEKLSQVEAQLDVLVKEQ